MRHLKPEVKQKIRRWALILNRVVITSAIIFISFKVYWGVWPTPTNAVITGAGVMCVSFTNGITFCKAVEKYPRFSGPFTSAGACARQPLRYPR